MTRHPAPFLILLVAVAFRFAVGVGSDYAVSPDGVTNLEMAEAIRSGQFADLSYFHPLYPTAIAAASMPFSISTTADLEWIGRLVSFLFGIATLFPLHRLALQVSGDRRTAHLAALLLAVWPFHVLLSVECLNMTAYVFFVTAFLASAWTTIQSAQPIPANRFLAPTFYLVAGYWTRPESAALWIFFLLVLGTIALHSPIRRKSMAKGLAVVFALFVLGVAPYAAFLKWQTGTWTVSRYVSNITAHTSAQPERKLPHQVANETASVDYLARGVIDHAGEITAKFARNFGRLGLVWFPRLFEPERIWPLGLFLAFVGLGTGFRQGRWGALGWLLGACAVSMAVVALHGGTTRYLAPLIPPLTVFIAFGLNAFDGKRITRSGVAIAYLLLLAPFALEPALRPGLGMRSTFPAEFKLGGEAIRAMPSRPARVVARKPQVGFYAGLPVRAAATWDRAGIETAVAGQPSAVVVLDERETLPNYPALAEFFADPPPAGWTVVFEASQPPRLRVLRR